MASESKNNIELDRLRERIRGIDDEILVLLVKRVELAREIGLYKKQNSLPIFDPQRERFNCQRNRELSRGRIPEPMVDELSDFLANWAREIQKTAR